MSKDAYYFSHDSNAFHDQKIIKLRMEFGLEGYGFYWALIEILRNESNYEIENDCDALSFHLNIPNLRITRLMNKCISVGLFVETNNIIYSESLKTRMNIVDKRRVSGSKGGKAKALATDLLQAKAKQTSKQNSSLKESKGKEKKEDKKSKPKKVFSESVKLTEEEYQKLKELYGSEDNRNEAIEILNNYLMSTGKSYKSHFHVMKKNGWVYAEAQKGNTAAKVPKDTRNLTPEIRKIMGYEN